MKSTAKSLAWTRDLKDRLVFRGFAVAESFDADGWAKLTLDTDIASIKIVGQDAISKDVFGNALVAFTPHILYFASRDNAMSTLIASELMIEIAKLGIKVVVQTHATVLATAEAAVGTELQFDVQWPNKGC